LDAGLNFITVRKMPLSEMKMGGKHWMYELCSSLIIEKVGNYPRYACVRYLRELLSLLVFINGGYFAVSLYRVRNKEKT